LEHAETLVVANVNELTEHHGFGTMATARPPTFNYFHSRTILLACGWRTTPVKSLVSLGVGSAVICGFSPSYS
jgi:hypothetical protein